MQGRFFVYRQDGQGRGMDTTTRIKKSMMVAFPEGESSHYTTDMAGVVNYGSRGRVGMFPDFT